MKLQLMILSALVTCSCTSNATSNESPKLPTIQADYQISDGALNNAFSHLNTQLPESLKISLKQEQTQWLKQRGIVCHYHNLDPKKLQTLTCFIHQNSMRIKQLTEYKHTLDDVFNKKFIAIDQEKIILEFI